ncbi:MAG: neutral/alkaline non-lysosomal ceramidase N-terminal domain-containing protein [Lunatimonas sp.]|uniref:neutral/alkaline non-lysosomal ceramidase N-terminal domain-containing protein n=1 Tax=Lunatimonas sp. TaxID=2060141 RepID=UPI00263A8186|nr:neutral/alkaline non-lysosomal ceramidase N-terminal domain-containing protein [Lunatimonas sp.]MCC5936247.1 neutral/alkaline non-lysosomal ceramidase N-terminal domain-containing protein [Lunatimonas sp.]
MNKIHVVIFILLLMGTHSFAQTKMIWKAGISKTVITPDKPMWMAGYAARSTPATGTYHDLWAKAVVLEDQSGKQSVLVTADILGFPKKMADRIRQALREKYGWENSQIILNGSHTHSGPVLEEALYDIYPLDEEQLSLVKSYSRWLEATVVALIDEAKAAMEPARLSSANGVARFQVNRRNNSERDIVHQIELAGPNDHAVPVIKIESPQGDLLGIVFGYACHPTVLDHYSWSGDYPGFAQIELERMYPGTVALFFQGASGDQNPIPRRSLPLAKQYGKSLAAAVERVLDEEMKPLEATIHTAYTEIPLALAAPPSKAELTRMANEQSGYMQRWAERMLTEQTMGKTPLSSYPYPLQIWQLGDQRIFNMGGEVTVAYANELKAAYGQDSFVMAYSNDVMGYIPSEIILDEGGYEGYSSQMVYGLPSTWEKGIEQHILGAFDRLAEELGMVPARSAD